MKRILVGVDGSKHGEKALKYSLDEAEELSNEITVVRVVRSVGYSVDEIGNVIAEKVESAEEYMDELNEMAEEWNAEIETEVITGEDIHNELVRYADENDFDLIVLGGKGGSDLGTIHLGSVSESVVKRANCSVLIVR